MTTAGSPGRWHVSDTVASSRQARAVPEAVAGRQDGATPEALPRLDHREILHQTGRPDPRPRSSSAVRSSPSRPRARGFSRPTRRECSRHYGEVRRVFPDDGTFQRFSAVRRDRGHVAGLSRCSVPSRLARPGRSAPARDDRRIRRWTASGNRRWRSEAAGSWTSISENSSTRSTTATCGTFSSVGCETGCCYD